MIVNYNLFNELDTPIITLCNPNRIEVGILDNITSYKLLPQFNAQSSLELSVYNTTDFNTTYQLIKKDKVLLIQDIGYFVITYCQEVIEGDLKTKELKAESYEVTLINEDIAYLDGTFKFYNSVTPYDPTTLMGILFKDMTDWTFGFIDTVIASRYRTFDVPDNNLYNFVMTDVEKAYDCIFEFNPLTLTINVYNKDNYVNQTSIYISNEDLAEQISQTANEDNIVTSCFVQGDNELGINEVNPLGTNYIYDFSYYKTTEWMTQGLIDKITSWENYIVGVQTTYSNLLVQLKTENSSLETLQAELLALQEELINLNTQRDVIISNNGVTTTINGMITTCKNNITTKQGQISTKQTTIDGIIAQITTINNNCKLSTYFTPSELTELRRFIKTTKYIENSIVVTDTMTYEQIQAQQLELYNLAKGVLSRNAQPTYEYDLDCKSFIFSKDFQAYAEQLRVGYLIDIRLSNGEIGSFLVLKLDVDYYNKTLAITLGNRFRLNNSSWLFANTESQSAKTNSTLNIERSMYAEPIKSGDLQTVVDFTQSPLDLAKNMVMSADGQTTEMTDTGLHSRAVVNGVLQPEEIVITNRVIAFTDNNWQTVKTAIGKLSYTNSQGQIVNGYGVVADYIIGNMIIGNNLTIENSTSQFKLTDKLVINTSNFKIDADGNVTINGIVNVTSGGNLLYDYDSFEQWNGKSGNEISLSGSGYANISEVSISNTYAYHGRYSLKLTTTSANSYCYLNPLTKNNVGYIPLEIGKYVLSCYVYSSVGGEVVVLYPVLRQGATTSNLTVGGTTTLTTYTLQQGWNRIQNTATITALTQNPYLSYFVRTISAPSYPSTLYYDAFQFEKVSSNPSSTIVTPSLYKSGGLSYLSGTNMGDGSVELAKLGTTVIQGGYIKTELLDANYIRTQGLFVGSENLLWDYDSFDQLNGLSGSSLGSSGGYSTLTVNNEQAMVGLYGLKMVSNSTNCFLYVNPKTKNANGWLPLKLGRYIISAYVRTTSVTDINARFYADATQGETQTATTSGVTVVNAYAPINSSLGWTRVYSYITVTSLTQNPYLRDFLQTNNSTATLYWDCLQIEYIDSTTINKPSPFKYGGSTTINGGNIITNSVTAQQINVTDLFAQNIVASGSLMSSTYNSTGVGSYFNLGTGEVVVQSTIGNSVIKLQPQNQQILGFYKKTSGEIWAGMENLFAYYNMPNGKGLGIGVGGDATMIAFGRMVTSPYGYTMNGGNPFLYMIGDDVTLCEMVSYSNFTLFTGKLKIADDDLILNKGYLISPLTSLTVWTTSSGMLVRNNANAGLAPVTASAFNTSSSKRYKDHIEYMTEVDANKLLQLETVKFDYINGTKGQYGLYAEDVYDIIPQCVHMDKGTIEGIDYSKLIPFLIKKVQMQNNEIENLKALTTHLIGLTNKGE